MAGDAPMAKPPMPIVSVMALSPRSGLASSGENPGNSSPSTRLAGPVNHRSPSPLTRMPNSTPLRDMAVSTVEFGMPDAASSAHLHEGMDKFRK